MIDKKKSNDKDVYNLRQLLRENILSSSKNNMPKDIYTKTSPNLYKHNPKSSPTNKKNKNTFSFSMLKYKPKRLINFKGINIPLPTLGKASLDYSKTLCSEMNSEMKKSSTTNAFNSKPTIKKNSNINKIEDLIKDDNLIEFKNIYILKYAQYSDNFSKFHQYKEIITDAKKRDFEDLYSKISKSLEIQSQTLLNDLDNENKNINNICVSPYTTTSQMKQGKNNNFLNKNGNISISNKKKILAICADYSFYIIRFINLLLKQIKEYKNEIIKLLKNNHEYELKINTLTKELDDIKNYLNKYSISKRIFGEKEKENAIKLIKDKYTHKENEYIVSMYKLQDEIHSLMKLLEKNKNYYNKFKDVEKEVNNNKKNNDLLRLKFNKELHEKNLQFAIEKDKREELINQLNELNNTIKELKEQKDQQKRQEIEITAQVLKMKIVIDEKNESLMMMSEELEHYMREYNREKYNYQNTLTVLRALENRIYNEEKDKKNENENGNYISDESDNDKEQNNNENKNTQLKLN